MNLKNYYYYFKSALTPEICNQIMEYGKSKIAEEKSKGNSVEGVTVGNQERGSLSEALPQNDLPLADIEEKTYIRDSNIVWLSDKWLYDIVNPFVGIANTAAGWNWEFDWHEPIQFTEYNPSGFYGWHTDGGSDIDSAYKRYIYGLTETPVSTNRDMPFGYVTQEEMVGKVRKISMTINLNNPGEYDGGELKFDFGHHRKKEDRFHTCTEIRDQGSVIIFPSFINHCVTPITRGTRYSLVMWTLGAPWK